MPQAEGHCSKQSNKITRHNLCSPATGCQISCHRESTACRACLCRFDNASLVLHVVNTERRIHSNLSVESCTHNIGEISGDIVDKPVEDKDVQWRWVEFISLPFGDSSISHSNQIVFASTFLVYRRNILIGDMTALPKPEAGNGVLLIIKILYLFRFMQHLFTNTQMFVWCEV